MLDIWGTVKEDLYVFRDRTIQTRAREHTDLQENAWIVDQERIVSIG